jgi:hypothetical protein
VSLKYQEWFDLDTESQAAWMRARSAYNYIRMYPQGCAPITLKRFFGLKNGSFESLLCAMETYNFLVYESVGGKLHTFENRAFK